MQLKGQPMPNKAMPNNMLLGNVYQFFLLCLLVETLNWRSFLHKVVREIPRIRAVSL